MTTQLQYMGSCIGAVNDIDVPAFVQFGQRTQYQQVSGPGVEGQSAVFNPSSLPLTNCPS